MLAKNKIRYFSHDVDMRNDLKIRGLRRKFGNDGYATWCYLLEVLTDTEDLRVNIAEMGELLAADFDISTELLTEIVDYCTKVGLLLREGDDLYSERLRERISLTIDKARAKSEHARKAVQARWNKSNTDVSANDTDVIHENTHSYQLEENRVEEIGGDMNRKEKKRDEYPIEGVVALWNETCVDLPKVKSVSETRRKQIKARLQEWGGNTQEEMLANANEVFRRIQASDFASGRNGKWTGATFDWIISSRTNWVKVMEGNYDNQRKGAFKPSSAHGTLGIGEFINEDGERTYGSGKCVIPQDAPPRPSERHSWNASNGQWILL